jgi:hypothetical protein
MTARAIPLALLASAVVATVAHAQALGLPVVNSGVVTGVAIGADVGFANQDAGKATTLGANASVGLGLFSVGGTIARWDPSGAGDAVWSPAATVTYRLFGGPLVPLRVMLQGGYGWWKSGDETVHHVPVSLGIAVTIPNPAFAIKPWLAPRYDLVSSGNGSGETEHHFGLSGGIDLTMLSGMSLRAAYDRVFAGQGVKPGILSFGVGFQP